MKQPTAQSGFAGLGLLLGLAVLLVLAGVGVLIYNKNQTAQPDTATPQPQATTPTETSTSPNGIPGGITNPPPSPSASNDNSIVIGKVGMKISVPNSLKDLTYATRTTANNSTIITFSTTTLTKAIPSCAAGDGEGAFTILVRGAGNYPGPANPSSGGLLKQYSGYYFAYNLPTSPCATGLSVEQQNLLNNLAQDFYNSLGSVQAS